MAFAANLNSLGQNGYSYTPNQGATYQQGHAGVLAGWIPGNYGTPAPTYPTGNGDSGPGTISNAPALQYGQQIMQTAMDPQNALYNRTQQQMTDQIRAGLAARGLDMSGAGQGVETQGMNNFNIDWQNNQLGRQVQGAGAYQGLAGLAQNIANQGFQNWGEYGQSQFRAPAAPQASYYGGQPMGGGLPLGGSYWDQNLYAQQVAGTSMDPNFANGGTGSPVYY